MSWTELEETLNRELSKHRPNFKGLRAGTEVRCECGYVTSVEEAGKTRPVGEPYANVVFAGIKKIIEEKDERYF